MRLVTVAILVATVALGGCASIVSGHNQSVSVTSQSDGTAVAGAKCSLSNDKGQWFTTTPGSVTVRRSYEALAVDCKTDSAAGTAQVKSITKPMAFGNIIFGGVIGVGVDVATGAAYDYPEVIAIPLMGFGVSSPTIVPPVAASPVASRTEPSAPAPVVPVLATAPVAAATPAVASKPATPAKAIALVGQDSFAAGRLAQSMQCNSSPTPVIVGKSPGSETYSVACSNGDVLAIRCDFGTCRALK